MRIEHTPHSRAARGRRGSVGVVVILILVLVQVAVVSVVVGGARDQAVAVNRMESIRAFYAAEAGMNMSLREVREDTDEDGDGGVGTISDDGNDANNPAFGSASVMVTSAQAGSNVEVYAVGSAGDSVRQITSVMPPTGSTGQFGFVTAFADGQLGVAGKQIATQVTVVHPGYVSSITTRVNGPPSKVVRFAVYTDSGGEPANLVVQSGLTDIDNDAAHYEWMNGFVPSTWLNAGTYWLAMCVEHSNVEYSYDGVGGQTRYNNNDATGAGGFTATWGSSTSSSTRRVNLFANVLLQRSGPSTFSSSTDYDNTNPQATGVFRDVTQSALINRGADISSNATHYNAINFWQASGLVSNCLAVHDTTPTTVTPTTFEGTIRVSADVLVTGTNNERYIGVLALHSETSGQQGLALAIKEDSNKDRLVLWRMPQNGDVSGATILAETGNYNNVSANNWYRVILDIVIDDDNLSVDGYALSHSTAGDPNSGLNTTPIMTLSYSGTVSGLTGLQTVGETGVFFDTTYNASHGSLTNFTIDFDAGENSGGYIETWSESEHIN